MSNFPKPTQQDWEAVCWTWAEAKRSQQRLPRGNTKLALASQAAVEEAELEVLAMVSKFEAAALRELSTSASTGKAEKPPIVYEGETLSTTSEAWPPITG